MFAATGEEVAFPEDGVEVGRVVGAWGVKGGIRVKPFSSDPQALFSTKRWFLQAPVPQIGPKPAAKVVVKPAPTGASQPVWPLLLRITQAREQGGHIVATAQELADRDAAEALGGARIFISRASFPTPHEDEFYWVDLIGLAVRNREGVRLGAVVDLVQTGPTCVLRVRRPTDEAADGVTGSDEEECLIPFVSAYVDRVDLADRCVHVDWHSDY